MFVLSYDFLPNPDGHGYVYVVEDGLGIKIGHTTGQTALRIGGLQTGNPRLISTIAIIPSADPNVEDYLHTRFSRWLVRGEWFDRGQLLTMAKAAEGWGNLLRSQLPAGDWMITVYPPYA